jgi:hypothetical protein
MQYGIAANFPFLSMKIKFFCTGKKGKKVAWLFDGFPFSVGFE